MNIQKRQMANTISLVNRNVVRQEEVLQMGLSSCNVRCISTHIAKGKVLSKVNV